MSSQRSCRWVKSGSTRSTPGWCSSGNSTPQSMISSRPSNSSTAMLRPISPTPPSGMTRRKPGGSGGGSSSNCGTLRPYSARAGWPLAGVWSTGVSASAPTVARVSTTVHEAAGPAGRPSAASTSWAARCATSPSPSSTSRPPAARPRPARMITEIGAVKVRGGEVLGEFQTLVNPRTEIPPFIAVLTGISNAMVADAPPIESALPAFLEFAAGTRPGRPQRAVRRRLPQALRRAAGPGLAGVRGGRHRQAGAPGDHPRRRPQLQAVLAGAGVPLHHDAQPPRPLRRAGHRRRAARADGAARRPRRAHARGAADVLRAGVDRPAPQAPPRRGAAALPRRLPVLRRRAAGSSTSAPRATCAPGCAPTSPPPRPGPGWARWSGSRPRSRASSAAPRSRPQVRELRLIAEHKPRYNRRSRFPERVHFVKLTREPWPRLSLVTPGARRRRRLPRPVLVAQGRREVPGRAPRDLPGPPVQRPVRQGAVPRAVRARRAGPLPLAVRRQRRRHDVRRGGAAAPGHAAAPARRGGRGDQPPDGRRWPPTSGSRRPASTATGWRRSCGPRPAPSGSPRSPAAPRSWPPGARTTAAGRSTSSATAGWPRPA